MAEYSLTPAARLDMQAIRRYLKDAPEQVRLREIQRLLTAFEQAAQFRFSGRREPQVKWGPAEVRSIFSFPYRVYYIPATHPVQIITVRHGRQKPPARI